MATSQKDLEFMARFLADNNTVKDASLNEETADMILRFILNHRKADIEKGDVILNVEMGAQYGNIGVYKVRENAKDTLCYPEKDYEYVDIKAAADVLYFSPKSTHVQPFDKNGPLYIPYSWQNLVEVASDEKVNIYMLESPDATSISMPVWGFQYNKFYCTVRFGVCIPGLYAEKVAADILALINPLFPAFDFKFPEL
jgi:hypothetical protein